ncbi:hemin import ATP-binding protein HmuV-like [Mercenaria mercenaria]|uniref:hemin import ATP-binding protein HmuV-like n=1 Tax=Mercenaria mercenaria TaxID=6596 RepID=UPI001E1DF475|nr:hemin import ATP-binding protein HmuV-like [Mercenaria mercenaria]
MKAVTGDSVLSVADISVDIGPAKILHHVSFSTCNGDVLAVMGPTGSGKTTVLNAIAGRQPLSTGNIYLSGQKIQQKTAPTTWFRPSSRCFLFRPYVMGNIIFYSSHDHQFSTVESILL